MTEIAYAVRMSDGHYVGIWKDRATADPYAATRRAITRAAAEIGRATK